MSRITLTPSEYSIIPEGTYVFKVKSVEYKEEFGKLTINLVTKDGQTMTERYGLLNAKKKPNEGALKALSYMVRCCTNFECGDDIDPDELVGKYIKATVEHTEVDSTKNPGTKMTYANLRDKHPAPNGFDEEVEAPATSSADVDLDALLDE